MDARERRIAQNEHTFRVLNEGVREVEERLGDGAKGRFFCECARSDCTEVVVISLERYQTVRSSRGCFIVRNGHELSDVEDVVHEERDFAVVKKRHPARP